jgi:effector-binding domain-containing protein
MSSHTRRSGVGCTADLEDSDLDRRLCSSVAPVNAIPQKRPAGASLRGDVVNGSARIGILLGVRSGGLDAAIARRGGLTMALAEQGFVHKQFDETLVATIRSNIKKRDELPAILDRLTQAVPADCIAGPAFCIYRFISSVPEGFDVEVGFPVTEAVETDEVQTRTLPAMEVLSLVHEGPIGALRESYGKLYGYVSQHALISDEFSREVLLDLDDPEQSRVELQFVLHNWSKLLDRSLGRVLDEAARREVMHGSQDLSVESTVDERHEWVKGVVDRLDRLATDDQKYEILSRCAHVFPREPIDKLSGVYQDTRARGGDPLQAIDAVLDLMEADPAWARRPVREGNVIYATKNPRDRKGYEEARTDAERRRA